MRKNRPLVPRSNIAGSWTRGGVQKAATRRSTRREVGVTVRGPVNNPTECHTGGGEGGRWTDDQQRFRVASRQSIGLPCVRDH